MIQKSSESVLQFFVGGITARTAAELVGVSRSTATLYYQKIRQVICYHFELESEEYFAGEVELDESYFGGSRKGKRGRGSVGKVIVFGILKRGGKVYAKVNKQPRPKGRGIGARTTLIAYLHKFVCNFALGF